MAAAMALLVNVGCPCVLAQRLLFSAWAIAGLHGKRRGHDDYVVPDRGKKEGGSRSETRTRVGARGDGQC